MHKVSKKGRRKNSRIRKTVKKQDKYHKYTKKIHRRVKISGGNDSIHNATNDLLKHLDPFITKVQERSHILSQKTRK